MRKIILICFILLWPAVAQANIGEDGNQVAARYGKSKVIAGQLVYLHEGFSITVYFDRDHSAMEIFTRNTTDPDKSDLSQQDIDRILDAEGEGQKWNSVQVSSGKPTWIRADNKIIARFSPNASGKPDDASVLIIMINAQ